MLLAPFCVYDSWLRASFIEIELRELTDYQKYERDDELDRSSGGYEYLSICKGRENRLRYRLGGRREASDGDERGGEKTGRNSILEREAIQSAEINDTSASLPTLNHEPELWKRASYFRNLPD